MQKAAKCIVGKDYPMPMVDHTQISRVNMERMRQVYKTLLVSPSGQYCQIAWPCGQGVLPCGQGDVALWSGGCGLVLRGVALWSGGVALCSGGVALWPGMWSCSQGCGQGLGLVLRGVTLGQQCCLVVRSVALSGMLAHGLGHGLWSLAWHVVRGVALRPWASSCG